MANEMLERIARQAGAGDLVEILATRLSPTDLQSLLLEVYRRRASELSASDVLGQYSSNRLVRPARLDVRSLLRLDALALALLPNEFEVLELSPVAPLGTASAVAPIDQNWVVSPSGTSR